ncbi:uncharacterized protein LOC123903918 isoform X2 [Trifolium pratense]|uniref:uncharacterized protein LOC123903918 isoform X2 n=1 Tax=Trifolium pratense TaxID=57577 RepID=UPI001E69399F|nr:uncharacterized protein LOC123903918 isoform X2 [Trifolium pratense]
MDNSILQNNHTPTPTHSSRSTSSRSLRDVRYSCGSCGYDLNLSSSNRNTSSIDSKYGKSIKRVSSNGAQPSPSTKTPTRVKYSIRIRALQPSSSQESGNGISVLA